MKEPEIPGWANPAFTVYYDNSPESYTYSHLPFIKMGEDEVELTKKTLQEAIKYKDLISVQVSEAQFEHLFKELSFMYNKPEPNTIQFFYHLIEGSLNFFRRSNGDYVLWVYPTGIPGHAQDRLIEEVIKNIPCWREGLNIALDPSWGGVFTRESLKVAALIIYG